jgi:hypothetical protein
MTPNEIKRAHMDSERCVVCGVPTREGLNSRFCPKGCDLKKSADDSISLSSDEYTIEWDETGFVLRGSD